MKKILLNLLITGALATTALSGNAQAIVDLQVSAAVDRPVYPGFIANGKLNVTFNFVNCFVDLPANALKIQLGLPSAGEFEDTYPDIPSGWSYIKYGPRDAALIPTATMPWLNGGTLYAALFQVPFHTVQAAPAPQAPFTGAQLVNLDPGVFQDNNPNNNQSTTTLTVQNTPLPVTFESFEVSADECAVNLNWVTSNEKNTSQFNIERSADGVTFETIDKVNASGNSTMTKRYHFIDANPMPGRNFYRIGQVDYDGKKTTTAIRNATVKCGSMSQIQLYPNPARDYVQVKGMPSSASLIRVFNVVGQMVMEVNTVTDMKLLNLEKLASGTYNLQVIGNNTVLFSDKFVKAK